MLVRPINEPFKLFLKDIIRLIVPPFTFFEKLLKVSFSNAVKHRDPLFGVTPEGFDAVDVMTMEVRKLISAVIDSVVLVVANIN